MSCTTTKLNAITEFNIAKTANSRNNYDPSLVHGFAHTIMIRHRSGEISEMALAQLETIAALVNEYPNMGKAIDHLFAGLSEEKQQKVHKKTS